MNTPPKAPAPDYDERAVRLALGWGAANLRLALVRDALKDCCEARPGAHPRRAGEGVVNQPLTAKERPMKLTTIALSAAFLGCIVAANYVTTAYGMVPVLPGIVATAGTWFAGITFVLRDSLQDRSGRWPVLALIVAGAVLSAVLSPAIALASGVAFLVSETADLAVYTPLRERGYVRAAVASNVVGAFLDTVLFLAIAGFPIWAALPGQMLVKVLVTFLGVAAVVLIRRTRRQPVTA